MAVWVPLSAGCCDRPDIYALRSALGPGIVITEDVWGGDRPNDSVTELLRRAVAEQREVARYFYGNFYPLLNFSLSDEVWALWQFDRPDLGEGLILAFRRAESLLSEMEAHLKALSPTALYEVCSLDHTEAKQLSGLDLMEHGLHITIPIRPGSALFIYRRLY